MFAFEAALVGLFNEDVDEDEDDEDDDDGGDEDVLVLAVLDYIEVIDVSLS